MASKEANQQSPEVAEISSDGAVCKELSNLLDNTGISKMKSGRDAAKEEPKTENSANASDITTEVKISEKQNKNLLAENPEMINIGGDEKQQPVANENLDVSVEGHSTEVGVTVQGIEEVQDRKSVDKKKFNKNSEMGTKRSNLPPQKKETLAISVVAHASDNVVAGARDAVLEGGIANTTRFGNRPAAYSFVVGRHFELLPDMGILNCPVYMTPIRKPRTTVPEPEGNFCECSSLSNLNNTSSTSVACDQDEGNAPQGAAPSDNPAAGERPDEMSNEPFVDDSPALRAALTRKYPPQP